MPEKMSAKSERATAFPACRHCTADAATAFRSDGVLEGDPGAGAGALAVLAFVAAAPRLRPPDLDPDPDAPAPAPPPAPPPARLLPLRLLLWPRCCTRRTIGPSAAICSLDTGPSSGALVACLRLHSSGSSHSTRTPR